MQARVVSNKSENTLIVLINQTTNISKYNKRSSSKKRRAVHCINSNKYSEGQMVNIVPYKKVSKTKSWIVEE